MFSPPLFWALLGVLLIGAEFFIPEFALFFFGAGALITALAAGFVPGLSDGVLLQLGTWVFSSIALFFLLRKKFGTVFRGNLLQRTGSDEAGKSAVVIEQITPEKPGRVRYQGTSWQAVSYTETLEPGEKADILSQEDLVFVVTRSIFGENENDGLDE